MTVTRPLHDRHTPLPKACEVNCPICAASSVAELRAACTPAALARLDLTRRSPTLVDKLWCARSVLGTRRGLLGAALESSKSIGELNDAIDLARTLQVAVGSIPTVTYWRGRCRWWVGSTATPSARRPAVSGRWSCYADQRASRGNRVSVQA